MKAKLDDRDAFAEAIRHVRGVYELCAIAGRPDLFLELLERGGDPGEVIEELYVQAFGPRPPWPRLIANPVGSVLSDD